MIDTPPDAEDRRQIAPVICYPNETLPDFGVAGLRAQADDMPSVAKVTVPPRDAATFDVPAGGVFRISCPDGSQVGDLNLWNAHDLSERFFSGKTRALHGTHVTTGCALWSNLPFLRPMAVVIDDSLEWYGQDAFGGRVHDVIGTRCDPYTHHLLNGQDYHYCCHSNLTRALADARGLRLADAEPHIHDVLNVFMCTGFSRDTGQYFMKASPARSGDQITFFAQIDLLGALSACPGGDCSTTHSSDVATCHPLLVEVFAPARPVPPVPLNGYDRSHGR
ncbi:DUF1989 domain-containing protein [Actibacterium sp. 188UL27-1]|uniref:urea carboxylase-associated family protein n=1 Tax=Actibacterium sp. 188UL27-1 TaxID=2786961 RepID=UPI00195889DF|nr:DUF1989 domain-containing protein [Actibacterium sp. 188UL27-1]MBM7066530.1 DUF1989 domain-containing protein [Actibacterium sp. 188UL27-1]